MKVLLIDDLKMITVLFSFVSVKHELCSSWCKASLCSGTLGFVAHQCEETGCLTSVSVRLSWGSRAPASMVATIEDQSIVGISPSSCLGGAEEGKYASREGRSERTTEQLAPSGYSVEKELATGILRRLWRELMESSVGSDRSPLEAAVQVTYQ